MGQEIHELRGVITADPNPFVRAVGQAIKAGQDFTAQWGRAASDLVSMGSRIAVGITGMATAIGTAVAVTGTKFNALQQNSQIAFSTILRDGAKAKAFLADLQKFAAETPFSFGGLIKNAQFLLATGTSLKEIIPTLRVLGDTMSGLGKGENELQMVATALSQIRSSAKLSAQDMAQLTNQGIPAWKILGDAVGKTVGEVRKMSEAGAFSGEQAFQILMGGLQQRFGGGMAAASGTFDQLLSNLKDTFDIRSAEVTKPLFDALTRVFAQFAEYLNSSSFAGVIQSLTEKFAAAGRSIEQWFGQNKAAIVETLTQSLQGLATGLTNMIDWMKQSGPGLMDFARSLGDMIRTVGRFIADHPQVLAALAVWKGAEMIGAVSAIGSLTQAIVGTVSALVKLVPAMTAATGATASLSALFAPGVGIALAAAFFTVLIVKARELRAELEANRAEMEKMRRMGGDSVAAGVAQSDRLGDPRARANALRQDLEAAKTEAANAQKDIENRRREAAAINRDMTVGDKISAVLPQALGGFDAREEIKLEQQKAEERWTRASAAISEIEAKIKQAEAEAKGGAAGAGAGGLGGAMLPAAQAQVQAVDAAASEAASAWNQRVEDVTKRMEDSAYRWRDLAQNMNPEQVQILTDSMQRLSNAYLDGQITQEQYSRAVNDLNRTADAAAGFSEKLQQLERDGKMSAESVAQYNGELSALMAQYQNGSLTADGFARGLRELNSEMAQGAAEAEREAAAKERQRLMSGQFTQDEFRTAFEDRIIQMQRARFNQMVDMQFGQWANFNGFLNDTSSRFSTLNTSMGQFGNGLQRATGFLGGMGGGGGMNWNAIAAAFNTQQAQRDMLFNEMQMLLQYFRPSSSPYDLGLDPQRRARYEGRIAEIQSILDAPPPPPMFTGVSGDQIIGDPGLQNMSATRGANININLPNINRVTNSDMRQIATMLSDELARQGRRL